MSTSANYPNGARGGEANHTLQINEMPMHLHVAVASSAVPNAAPPLLNYPAANATQSYSATATTTLGPGSSPAGGGQAHNNMPPYIAELEFFGK